MKKKCKVVMLPTEKEGVIMTDVGPYNTDMVLISDLPENLRTHDRPHNHLYLISDDEIKAGDWFINLADGNDGGKLHRCISRPGSLLSVCKKVIASTDISLSIHEDVDGYGLHELQMPQFSEDFIKAYVKANGEIDEVMVEYFDRQENVVLRTGNTVIISEVKEKTYTQQDLIYAVAEIAARMGQTPTSEDMKRWNDETKQWIEENL